MALVGFSPMSVCPATNGFLGLSFFFFLFSLQNLNLEFIKKVVHALCEPKPSLSGVSGGAPQRDRRSARWRRNTAGVRSARTYSRRRAPVRSSRAVAEAHAVAVPAPPLRAGCCPTLPAQAPRAAHCNHFSCSTSPRQSPKCYGHSRRHRLLKGRYCLLVRID